MTVCKSELKQCNGILIFTVKIILNMKILHCSPRNANTALLSNHSASFYVFALQNFQMPRNSLNYFFSAFLSTNLLFL